MKPLKTKDIEFWVLAKTDAYDKCGLVFTTETSGVNLGSNTARLSDLTEEQAQALPLSLWKFSDGGGMANSMTALQYLTREVDQALKDNGYVLWTEEYVEHRWAEIKLGTAEPALKPVPPEQIIVRI